MIKARRQRRSPRPASPVEKAAPAARDRKAPLPFSILHESPTLLVINKPAGLAVHPGPRTTESVEDWFPLMSRRRDGPWLAHRLDADTAGCLVIALRKQALIALQAAFSAGTVNKTYWAIVDGDPGAQGEIDLPLRRVSTSCGWRMVGGPGGQSAQSSWRRLATNGDVSLLELTLHTGRTHQARVHCAALGTPIMGDPIYGRRAPGGLHLVSRRLRFPAPFSLDVTAPLPPHMAKTVHHAGLSLPDAFG